MVAVERNNTQCAWAKGVWFSHVTPEFAFTVWTAMWGRLYTMDHISRWSQGIDTTWVLCKTALESRNHLFFECSFTSQIWEQLTKGILLSSYTTDWDTIEVLISDSAMERKKLFCIRYAFQATLYAMWRERNKRRHGEQALSMQILFKLIDKGI